METNKQLVIIRKIQHSALKRGMWMIILHVLNCSQLMFGALSTYLSIYLSLSLSISIYLFLSLSISIYIYLYLSISISIYIYLYLSISIYFYLYLSISIYIYLYLSISIYIYLSIYPSIHPSIPKMTLALWPVAILSIPIDVLHMCLRGSI